MVLSDIFGGMGGGDSTDSESTCGIQSMSTSIGSLPDIS